MTYDRAWAERVKSEFNELYGRITRLRTFVNSNPNISEQDLLLLKQQYDVMKTYAGILLTRLYLHNIEIDKEEN